MACGCPCARMLRKRWLVSMLVNLCEFCIRHAARTSDLEGTYTSQNGVIRSAKRDQYCETFCVYDEGVVSEGSQGKVRTCETDICELLIRIYCRCAELESTCNVQGSVCAGNHRDNSYRYNMESGQGRSYKRLRLTHNKICLLGAL